MSSTNLSPFSGSPASNGTPILDYGNVYLNNQSAILTAPTGLGMAYSVQPANPMRPPSSTRSQPKKSRKRVNTAEKRTMHNAVERSRRETLNSKFLSLARMLPTLASYRRPSKSQIVNAALEHAYFSRRQRMLASEVLRRLVEEREALIQEANIARARSGQGMYPQVSLAREMQELTRVDSENFGSFTDCEEADDEQGTGSISAEAEAHNTSFESGATNESPYVQYGGLTTPRSSADNGVPSRAYVPTQCPPVQTSPVNGTWSQDFACMVSSATHVPQQQTPAMPFATPLLGQGGHPGRSSSGSPANSGGRIVTPSTDGVFAFDAGAPAPSHVPAPPPTQQMMMTAQWANNQHQGRMISPALPIPVVTESPTDAVVMVYNAIAQQFAPDFEQRFPLPNDYSGLNMANSGINFNVSLSLPFFSLNWLTSPRPRASPTWRLRCGGAVRSRAARSSLRPRSTPCRPFPLSL